MPCVFSDVEIFDFLTLVAEENVYRKIDGKSQRNIQIFTGLAAKMNGDKSAEQWRGKWKALKAKYLEEKRKASKSGDYYLLLLTIILYMV